MTETPSIPIRRGYVDGRYGQIHYCVRNPETPTDAPPLVLLHQNPSSSLEYLRLIETMGGDRIAIGFDTPGYGMSDAPPGPLDMAGYAAAFVDALDALFDRPVDLFGFHTGTLLAIELALLAPVRVRRIVLSGIPMLADDIRAARLRAASDQPALDEAGDFALGQAKRFWETIVTARRDGVPLRVAADQWVERMKPLDRGAWAYRAVWGYDYADRLSRISHPTLVLQPHEDIRADSLRAAAMIAGADIVELPGMDRDIFFRKDDVRRIAVELRGWLA